MVQRKTIIINNKRTNNKKVKKIKKDKNNTIEYVKDDFLMNECKNATSLMLTNGIALNKVAEMIKSYQQIYIKLDKEDSTLSKSFTFHKFYLKCCKVIEK